jgi:hypothetical protein
MLALLTACVVYYAMAQRTPGDLYSYLTQILGQMTINLATYELMLKWCFVVAQSGIGANAMNSLLSLATADILGRYEHLMPVHI